MIILDTTLKTLEIVLAGAITTNQLPFTTSYVDITSTPSLTPISQDGASNSTTPVTVMSAPAASTQRKLEFFSISNTDTAAATVTLSLNDNSTLRTILKVNLSVGDNLSYSSSEGFRLLDSAGNLKAVLSPLSLANNHIFVGNASNAAADVAMSGDATIVNTGALTLATVNSDVGSFTNASLTVNAKGLVTAASSGSAPVTSVTGTANRITSTGGATPQIDISASYVGQSSITTVGTLTGGATGAGFTIALGTSTITGDLPFSNLTQIAGLSVLGVTGSSTADVAGIAGTANQILRVNGAGTSLAFGSIDLAQSASVGSSILGSANGGTANAFFAVSGPTTSTKTFTFPNSSATILTSAAAVTPAQGGTGVANGSNNTITFTGNFTLGLTLSNNTAVTLPTTGTLATLAGSEALTGKTYNGLTITTTTGTFTLTNGKTLSVSNSLTLAGTDSTTMTFPSTTSTVVTLGNTGTFTKGFATTPYNAGTQSSGTFTPDEANGAMQYAVNGGAHTLAPPTNNSFICIQYTNNGSAGAITTSGFTKVSGTFTTTSGDDFLCYITKNNGFSFLNIQALQ